MMKSRIQHIHFVGIGGAGMSGIAEMLLAQGYAVSGTDLADSATLQRLASLGARVSRGHTAEALGTADVVVVSTAVGGDNPEVLAARARGTPVVHRAQMLAELMRARHGIAVAGTHGKTTTTSLVTSVLVEGGLDPSFVIGGHLKAAGAHARLGQGDCIVVEADESDASFLHLLPATVIITNIDADHMDTYGHDVTQLKAAFVTFTQRLPFYGRAILCVDDAGVRDILPFVSRPVITYGLHPQAQVRAIDVRPEGAGMRFTVVCSHRDQESFEVLLGLPGLHNVNNALAAIAVGLDLGVAPAAIGAALTGFQGVGRRFTRIGDFAVTPAQGGGRFTLIDDYGHHPVEMAATLAAARGAFPGQRLVLAFQPHRYTRTRDCFDAFVRVLGEADAVLLTDVYAAGETPIASATGRALAQAVAAAGHPEPVFVEQVALLARAIVDQARDGDVVIAMGAGSISTVPTQMAGLAPAAEPALATPLSGM